MPSTCITARTAHNSTILIINCTYTRLHSHTSHLTHKHIWISNPCTNYSLSAKHVIYTHTIIAFVLMFVYLSLAPLSHTPDPVVTKATANPPPTTAADRPPTRQPRTSIAPITIITTIIVRMTHTIINGNRDNQRRPSERWCPTIIIIIILRRPRATRATIDRSQQPRLLWIA